LKSSSLRCFGYTLRRVGCNVSPNFGRAVDMSQMPPALRGVNVDQILALPV
jgi:hypothetical protein